MNVPPKIPVLDDQLCFNVYRLHLAFGRYYQAVFGDTGFTYTKFVILVALLEDGPMSLSALAARIGAESNSLSPVLKKMADHGLIERKRDPKDERRIVLTVLPLGTEVFESANRALEVSWNAVGLEQGAIDGMNLQLQEAKARVDAVSPSRMDLPKEEQE